MGRSHGRRIRNRMQEDCHMDSKELFMGPRSVAGLLFCLCPFGFSVPLISRISTATG